MQKATILPAARRFQLPGGLIPRLHKPSFLTVFGAAVAGLMLLPLAYLLLRAVGAGQDGLDYLLRERTAQIMWNSLVLVVTVTAAAGLIGVPFAWLTARTDLPYRRVWLVLGLLTMVIPSYLGAVTYVAMFGPKGMLQGWLEALIGLERLPDIRGWFGAWLSITLITFPFVTLPVRAALLNADPALEEAARSLGLSRWQVFRRVMLPQLRPALAAGLLVTALYTLSDFGAVAVMRYNAFTRAIFLQYTSSFNRENAAVLALVLVAITLILIYMEQRAQAQRRNYRIGTGARRQLRTVRLGRWRWPALLFCGALVTLGVLVPVAVLVAWLTGRVMISTIEVDMAQLTLNTVGVSALAAVVVALVALPLALMAVRSNARWGRWLVGLSYTGNVLPGIVIALALVFFAANYLPAWYQTVPLLVLGYAVRFLPLSISATRGALTQINPRLEEAARGLGLRPWQVTARVTVPLARAGIAAGAALVFLSAMKELPTTLVLAPIGLNTLATRIWTVYQEATLVLVGGPGLLLMALSALGLWIILRREQQQAPLTIRLPRLPLIQPIVHRSQRVKTWCLAVLLHFLNL
jgi:iron(III) transport system permease protein